MASRFTETHPVQRCFNPVRVFRNGHFDYFPCGRCSACLLDKANSWSMRLANEIETFPFSIFFTLTYSNKYLPTLHFEPDDGLPLYTSEHERNIRFDGVKDVLRHDEIFLPYNYVEIPISNYDSKDYISYSSKRDVQLWLKLLRQDIFETFDLQNKTENERKKYFIRYYIISEYGPTSRRSHFHGILFACCPEVANYLIRVSMYQNWSMCDKALFDEYTHYCESGASNYVTQYLTCSDNLPKILKDKSIRPFRLASKSPAIGFSSFDEEEIFESLFCGVNEYYKRVPRCEDNYVFPYPSEFMHRLLPKCREYSLVSYKRLRYVYGFLWRNVGKKRFSSDLCGEFLRSNLFSSLGSFKAKFTFSKKSEEKGQLLRHVAWFPQDLTATQKCFYYCNKFGYDVDTYLYLVDMYYYKESMFALRKFYEWQELHFNDSVSIMFSYFNFQDYVRYERDNQVRANTLAYFLNGFGLNLADLSPFDLDLLVTNFKENEIFRSEVEDIVRNMVKMPKFNEQFGFAPHTF